MDSHIQYVTQTVLLLKSMRVSVGSPPSQNWEAQSHLRQTLPKSSSLSAMLVCIELWFWLVTVMSKDLLSTRSSSQVKFCCLHFLIFQHKYFPKDFLDFFVLVFQCSIFCQGELYTCNFHYKLILAGPPNPRNTVFVRHSSTVVCTAKTPYPLHIEPRDEFNNLCSFEEEEDPLEGYNVNITSVRFWVDFAWYQPLNSYL